MIKKLLLAFGFWLALAMPAMAATINLTLTWQDNSSNEDGFIIESGNSTTGPFALLATTGANITTYTDANLQPNAQYCYRLKAFNAAGQSGYSNIACATTPGPPAAPGNVTVTITVTP